MTRNYGLSRRPNLGGNEHSAGALRATTLRELNSLPPLPSGAVLEPFNLDEPPSNEFSLFDGLFVSFVTGAAFVVAVLLLFVET